MKKQTDRPFNSLYDLCERFPDDKSCRQYLENHYWNNKPFCPHCGNDDKIYRFKDGKLFKYGTCRKHFTVTVGTIFHGSHVPLKKWLWAIFLFSSHKKGISSCQLAKGLKVQQKTAWFMLGRIRRLMANPMGRTC